MKQVFHIFRKDVRHLWIEILIGLAALALLTWTDWWLATPKGHARWYNEVVPVVLVVFCWWYLTVRLVQSEGLVGDRQFWVTRPILWYELLSAKSAFLVVFVGVPLAASEVILLLANGSPVTADMGEILLTVGGTFIVAVLPVLALATATRNMNQWLLGIITLVALVVGLAWIDAYIPNSHVSTGPDVAGALEAGFFASFAILGITLQYAKRSVFMARIVLGAAFAAPFIVMVLFPYRMMIDRTFPSREHSGITVALNRNDSNSKRVTAEEEVGSKAKIAFPIEIAGVSPGTILQLNGVMLSVQTSSTQWWDSEWQSSYQYVWDSGSSLQVGLELPRSIYDKLKKDPVPIALNLAVSELQQSDGKQVVVEQQFELPGVGDCWMAADEMIMKCRSAESSGALLFLALKGNDSKCQKTENSDEVAQHDSKPFHNVASAGASGPFSPLVLYHFSIFSWRENSGVGETCAGTPVTIGNLQKVGRFRLRADLGRVKLSDFAERKLDLTLR